MSNARHEEAERQKQAQVQAEADRKEAERKAHDPAEIARRQREAQEAQARAAENAQMQAEVAVRGKKPIPSEWDSITPEANAYLKANLKDYDSMKLVECSPVATYGNDAWCQRVKYRATNSFGGYVLEEKIFVIKDGQVINVVDY